MTTSKNIWRVGAAKVTLLSDEVHIWRVVLDVTDAYVHTLKLTLSADELKRAQRFYFEQDRTRFIVGRRCLKPSSAFICM
jgi:4'-phosphopantetheinyl transferase